MTSALRLLAAFARAAATSLAVELAVDKDRCPSCAPPSGTDTGGAAAPASKTRSACPMYLQGCHSSNGCPHRTYNHANALAHARAQHRHRHVKERHK